MKPKTQMRIGLFGAIALMIFGAYQFIYRLSSVSLPGLLGMLTSMILFTIYIFGIVKKKLKVVQKVYRAWWILAIISFSIVFLGILVAGKWAESFQSLFTVIIILLCIGLPYGFMTLILWVGLRGLERIIKAESELNEEKPYTAEEKAR